MSRKYHVDDDEPYVVIEKHSGSISSLFLGVAIGAGLALLFAPQSGAATRRRIRRRALRARDSAEQAVTNVTHSVVDTFSDARRRVEDRIDDARNAIEIRRQQVERAMAAGREAAQQAREELERRIAETKAAYQAGESGNGGARRPAPAARSAPAAPSTTAATFGEEPDAV